MRGVWEGSPAKSDFIKKWALTKHMMRGVKKGQNYLTPYMTSPSPSVKIETLKYY